MSLMQTVQERFPLCRALNVRSAVLPMSDDCVRTVVHSGAQALAFQDYFVRLKCAVPSGRRSAV